jgi:hypothetical protein
MVEVSMKKREDLKDKKNLLSHIGTKSISKPGSTDLLYDCLAQRIEPNTSVKIWSYVKEENCVTVKIFFTDEETSLDVKVNHNNLSDLQKFIETIDGYFATKRVRS